VKTHNNPEEYNRKCELENIISHSNLNEEIDENLTKIITENGKLCKCKNFVMAMGKLLALFMAVFALTGCISQKHKPKVYRHNIEFYQPEKLKVLYSEPEESEFEKYYRAHPIETDIAEIKLETHRMRKMNAYIEKFLKDAEERLKNFKEFVARKKAEAAETEKRRQQIEKMKKELEEINIRLDELKKKKQEEREKRSRS
jgi:hypothetical protein